MNARLQASLTEERKDVLLKDNTAVDLLRVFEAAPYSYQQNFLCLSQLLIVANGFAGR